MKNSIKFFLGGVVAAAVVFGALAFKPEKHTDNKDIIVVRAIESSPTSYGSSHFQIYKNDQQMEILKTLSSGKLGGIDDRGDNTNTIGKLINKYLSEGYEITSHTTTSSNYSPNSSYIINTIIFQK